MRHSILAVLAAAALLNAPPIAGAQTAGDAGGHWEGALTLPTNTELPFEVDLGTINGALAGTISVPSQQLQRMPLTSVKVEGQTVTFTIVGNGGGTFTGQLAGLTIAGAFSGALGSTPFSLKRTGPAKLDGPPRGVKLPAELEGTWLGTIEANGRTMRLQITMSNNADGTSNAQAVSLDEGNMALPITVTAATPAAFAFDIPATGSSYKGALNDARTAIAGTYEQRGFSIGLTFVRSLEK